MKLAITDVEEQDLSTIQKNAQKEFSKLVGSSILITGGAGFLGYYLVKSFLVANELHNAQLQVTVLDNVMLGVPDWIRSLQDRSDFTLLKQNLITSSLDAKKHYDYIIHAASIASPLFYRKYPLETMDANIVGLRKVLDYAKQHDSKGILFFSSSEVYGDPLDDYIPTPETYRGNVSSLGPRACYDESKRFGETLCYVFATKYDVPVKIVRPFNNYGPGMKLDDGRVIADFCRSIIHKKDIIMYSDGSPTRTYCYIADAIVGYLKALVHGRPAEPYNIGIDKPEVSVKKLAEMLVSIGKRQLNYTGKITFAHSTDEQYLTDNPNRRCPEIGKARDELKFNPDIPLEDGLFRTLSWYHQLYGHS